MFFQRASSEFTVNTTLTGNQVNASTAVLEDGSFIVVWVDASGLLGDPDTGIVGQRFDAEGNKIGGEFLINSSLTGVQSLPIVAALAGGGFVVTWGDPSGLGGDSDAAVKAQIFAADASKVGGEFLVNTITAGLQLFASVIPLSGGGFVIAWQDTGGSDGNSVGIKAQMFDPAGAPVGTEFTVNTVVAGPQLLPQMTALEGGGFAIVWLNIPGFAKVQLFDAAGTKVGGEIDVVAGPSGSYTVPRISALGSGFVVAWGNTPVGSTDAEAFGQVFDASGAKVGGAFEINTNATGNQNPIDVQQLPNGHFIVLYTTTFAPNDSDVMAQVFDSTGAKVGTEFVVHASLAGAQAGTSIVELASGAVAITWNEGVAPNADVKMQILDLAGAPTDITIDTTTISETAVSGLPVATLGASGGALNATYSFELLSDSTGGAFAVVGNRLVVVDNSLLDHETANTAQVEVRATDGTNSFTETLNLTISEVTVEDRYSAGEVFPAQQVDNFFDTVESVTALSGGGFVIVRGILTESFDQRLGAQIFAGDGTQIGSDLQLDIPAFSPNVVVTALTNGGFAVAFDGGFDGIGFSAKVQQFSATGAEVGPEVRIATDGGNIQLQSATLNNGNYVVTFVRNDPGGASDLYAQLFSPSGLKIGPEVLVHAPSGDSQGFADVAELPTGGYVVVWRETPGPSAAPGTVGTIQGQFFSATGAKVGAAFTVLTDDTGIYGEVKIDVLDDGSIVVGLIEEVDYDNGIYANGFQIVGADGVPVGGVVPNAVYAGNPELEVLALPTGGFLLTWEEIDQSGTDPDDTLSKGQFYTADGQPQGDAFVISDEDGLFESYADVDVLLSGDIVFGWTGLFQRASDNFFTSDTYARILTLAGGIPGNLIEGTARNDVLTGTRDVDVIYGFDGNDQIDGGPGADVLFGGRGNDTYNYGEGDQIIELPGEGTDTVRSGFNYTLGANLEILRLAGAATLGVGNELDNTIYGGREGATLAGLDGNDTIHGSTKDDVIFGGNGMDRLFGNAGLDTIRGGGDNDVINGGGNADTLYGDGGNDLIRGDAGNDQLFGGIGDDRLDGGLNNDTLNGDAGMDRLFGGDGADRLIGGLDRDILSGGLGADDFVFDEADFAGLTAATADRIVDFNVAENDDIDLTLVDAIAGGDDDAFTYIGNAAFSNVAGQLRWEHIGSNTMVFMDVDGDAVADYAIRLDGTINLAEASFIL